MSLAIGRASGARRGCRCRFCCGLRCAICAAASAASASLSAASFSACGRSRRFLRLSHSLSDGLSREGRTILGGDVSFARGQRPLSDDERSFLHGARTRFRASRSCGRWRVTMTKRRSSRSKPSIRDILPPARSCSPLPCRSRDALAVRDGIAGMVADEALSAKLDLKLGDRSRDRQCDIRIARISHQRT